MEFDEQPTTNWWTFGREKQNRAQNSSDLRLAINKVACKKQDSLIVQLFLNDDSIQSRSGKSLYNAVSA